VGWRLLVNVSNSFRILFVLLASFTTAVIAGDVRLDYPWLDKDKPYGLEKREQWTTSRIVGSPEPPSPYTLERQFPHLHFDRTLEIVNSPNGQRWFVCEDGGMIYSFTKDQTVERADVFLDIRRKDDRYLQWNEHRRIWSMAFHPKFSQNGYVYVCYLDTRPGPNRCRLSRFTVDVKNTWGPPQADVDSEFIVLEWVTAVDHFGGCLRFGPDNMLYFSAGDGGPSGDFFNTGQDITDFNASIMRIDVDKVYGGKTYGIPADNPFVNVAGARGEVWAYGLRNVWKMAFDKKTGALWAGDVGQDLWDMIDKVEKGGNYGWAVTEGTRPYLPDRKKGPTPILPPAIEHDHSEIRSITAGYVYHGTRLPDLTGMYIYGDYETGRLYGYKDDGKYPGKPVLLAETTNRIVAFGEDNDGELVILDYMGTLHRMIPSPKVEQTPFPKKLSETGLFASVKDHVPAPGVIPYTVNAPLWSDHAVKERFMAIPKGGKIDYNPNDPWRFPEGSVMVKGFGMQMKAGDPSSVKWLETRILHFELGQWRYYTYIWNDEQTDAELLGKEALDRELEISDANAPGGKRKQKWHFPSRAECTLCHTFIAGYALGTNTAQLNGMFKYANAEDNQLRAMDHIGMFKSPLKDYYKPAKDAQEKDPLPSAVHLAHPSDEKAPLEDRARAYMQGNCAHCHRMWGGGIASFQLQYTLPLARTQTVNAPPEHGDFGIEGAKILAPGAPEKSMLLHRMTLLGQGRMPHIASSVIDEEGVKLLKEWISKMK
jgi:uncharacterized repeat protein (TIGR03806 family)